MTISLSQTNEQIIVVTYHNTHLNQFINYLLFSPVLPLLQCKENEPFQSLKCFAAEKYCDYPPGF